MKFFIVLLAACSANDCLASLPLIRFANTGESVARRIDPDEFSARNGTLVYDNASFPSQGGRTHFISFPRFGHEEVGDDLILTDVSPGFLTDGAYSFRNLSATDSLQRFTVVHRWYDSSGMLGSVSETLIIDGGLPPLSAAIVESQGNLYRRFNIALNGSIHWSLQFLDVQGISIDDLSFVVAGPNTLGSSSSLLHNYTTGQDIDLGSNDANLMFKVSSAPAPAPTAGALGILSAIMACRRQR